MPLEQAGFSFFHQNSKQLNAFDSYRIEAHIRAFLPSSRNPSSILDDIVALATSPKIVWLPMKRGRCCFGSSYCLAPDELLDLAGAVEKGSEHQVGAAILARAREKELGFRRVEGFRAIGGLGVEHDRIDPMGGLKRLAAADEVPASAPRPVPTMIAVGVARPIAHGQAMTRTAMSEIGPA